MGSYGLTPKDIAHQMMERNMHYMEGDFTPGDFIRGAIMFLHDVQENEGHTDCKIWNEKDWNELRAFALASAPGTSDCEHSFEDYSGCNYCPKCNLIVANLSDMNPPTYCDDCGVDHGTGITCPEDGGTKDYGDTCDKKDDEDDNESSSVEIIANIHPSSKNIKEIRQFCINEKITLIETTDIQVDYFYLQNTDRHMCFDIITRLSDFVIAFPKEGYNESQD